MSMDPVKTVCTRMWDWGVIDLSEATVKMCCITRTKQVDSLVIDPIGAKSPFNSSYLNELRRKMLVGERPSECEICWRFEDLGGGEGSPRSTISSFKEYWADPSLKHVVQDSFASQAMTVSNMSEYTKAGDLRFAKTHSIRRLQLILSSTCNLKCWYCNESNSSTWEKYKKEHKQLDANFKTRKVSEELMQQFLLWFNKGNFKNLRQLNISGGEPALCSDFYALAEMLLQDRDTVHPDLEIDILTNFSLTQKVREKFFKTVLALSQVYKVKMSISMDDFGPRAEFIRDQLDWPDWHASFSQWLQLAPKSAVTQIRTTFSCLNLGNLTEFYSYLLEQALVNNISIRINENMVHDPAYLSPLNLPARFSALLSPAIDFLKASNSKLSCFNEIDRKFWLNMSAFLSDLQMAIAKSEQTELHPQLKNLLDGEFAKNKNLVDYFPEFRQ